MNKIYKMMALAGLMMLLAQPASSGTVTRTLGRYAAGGAGVGALLGAGGATVSFINTGQSFDFVTGAGLGILVGAGVGYLFGVIDLATGVEEQPVKQDENQLNGEEADLGMRLLPKGTFIGLMPSGPTVAFSFRF